MFTSYLSYIQVGQKKNVLLDHIIFQFLCGESRWLAAPKFGGDL